MVMVDETKKSVRELAKGIFAENPQLKARMAEYLAHASPEKREEDMRQFESFVSGELTWAEIKNFPRPLLKEIANVAYLKFQRGELKGAEALFKGLSIIDHTNWYYRAALGAIYQKQKLYEEAIEEYKTALLFHPKEITALTNRGECHMCLGMYVEALADFKEALSIDPQLVNPWTKRAKVLHAKLVKEGYDA